MFREPAPGPKSNGLSAACGKHARGEHLGRQIALSGNRDEGMAGVQRRPFRQVTAATDQTDPAGADPPGQARAVADLIEHLGQHRRGGAVAGVPLGPGTTLADGRVEPRPVPRGKGARDLGNGTVGTARVHPDPAAVLTVQAQQPGDAASGVGQRDDLVMHHGTDQPAVCNGVAEAASKPRSVRCTAARSSGGAGSRGTSTASSRNSETPPGGSGSTRANVAADGAQSLPFTLTSTVRPSGVSRMNRLSTVLPGAVSNGRVFDASTAGINHGSPPCRARAAAYLTATSSSGPNRIARSRPESTIRYRRPSSTTSSSSASGSVTGVPVSAARSTGPKLHVQLQPPAMIALCGEPSYPLTDAKIGCAPRSPPESQKYRGAAEKSPSRPTSPTSQRTLRSAKPSRTVLPSSTASSKCRATVSAKSTSSGPGSAVVDALVPRVGGTEPLDLWRRKRRPNTATSSPHGR